MTVITQHIPGTFCHVDGGTTDAEGAKKFYGALFGWQADDMPDEAGMVYTMFQLNGLDVAGMYQMGQGQGIPPMWNSYVLVVNADETARRAKELGGVVLQEPEDAMDAGRMAMIQDPTGAVFAVWQPNKYQGLGLINDPDCFCWSEMVTHDPQKASDFYAGLFGWSVQVTNMGNFDYFTFMAGEQPIGGMMKIQPEWGEVPPCWTVYFTVEDCDTAGEKIAALGGSIIAPPADIPNVGRFAMAQDPQGAFFYVMTMTMAAPPA
jgi:predicted enzyme related to lactoylglutathione lyase